MGERRKINAIQLPGVILQHCDIAGGIDELFDLIERILGHLHGVVEGVDQRVIVAVDVVVLILLDVVFAVREGGDVAVYVVRPFIGYRGGIGIALPCGLHTPAERIIFVPRRALKGGYPRRLFRPGKSELSI